MNERFIATLVLFLALDVYAYQAVRAWVSPYPPARRRWIKGLYWLFSSIPLGLLFVFLREGLPDPPRWVQTTVGVVFFMSFVSRIPVALVLLVDDLRRGFHLVMNRLSPVTERDTGRSRFLARAGLIAGGIPVATLTYGIVRNAYRYRRYGQEVPIEGLPAALDGFKIVQISDMHSGSWTRSEPLKEAVRMINAEAADLVCFTGDIVNSRAEEMQPFVPIFKEVRARRGVYSILGNHDYGDYYQWPSEAAKAANMQQLYDTHAALGWELLRDENRILEVDGVKVGLLGVENWSALRFGTRGDLAKAYAGSEDCDCRVLLTHDPTHWDAEVRPDYPDIDLTLSGHTHGFQFGVEIPGFRWSPAQYIYEQWAGLYTEGRQHIYVNRGLGFLGYPGRVGILPEITVLTLRTA